MPKLRSVPRPTLSLEAPDVRGITSLPARALARTWLESSMASPGTVDALTPYMAKAEHWLAVALSELEAAGNLGAAQNIHLANVARQLAWSAYFWDKARADSSRSDQRQTVELASTGDRLAVSARAGHVALQDASCRMLRAQREAPRADPTDAVTVETEEV